MSYVSILWNSTRKITVSVNLSGYTSRNLLRGHLLVNIYRSATICFLVSGRRYWNMKTQVNPGKSEVDYIVATLLIFFIL